MRRLCFWIEWLGCDWVWRLVFVVCLRLAVFGGETRVLAAEYRVFVGTYTGGESRGIYSFSLDASEEKVEAFRLAAEAENPSFLAIHPNRRFLYAVREVNEFEGEASGAVGAYQIQPDGSLLFLNQAATGGGAPCHLVVEATGSFLLVRITMAAASRCFGWVGMVPLGSARILRNIRAAVSIRDGKGGLTLTPSTWTSAIVIPQWPILATCFAEDSNAKASCPAILFFSFHSSLFISPSSNLTGGFRRP